MPKFSTAIAASALLLALASPSFAADIDSSTSQHGSTAVQDRDAAGTNAQLKDKDNVQLKNKDNAQLKDNDNAQLKDKDSMSGSTSLNSSSKDSDMDRDQSAQLPKSDQDQDQSAQVPKSDRDKDITGPGRSSTSPGHEMQENGSVSGSPGASGYAPGHASDNK